MGEFLLINILLMTVSSWSDGTFSFVFATENLAWTPRSSSLILFAAMDGRTIIFSFRGIMVNGWEGETETTGGWAMFQALFSFLLLGRAIISFRDRPKMETLCGHFWFPHSPTLLNQPTNQSIHEVLPEALDHVKSLGSILISEVRVTSCGWIRDSHGTTLSPHNAASPPLSQPSTH